MHEVGKIKGLKLLRAGPPRAKLTSMPPDKGKPRCSCGYRIRTKNHEDGDRHKGIVYKCKRH